MGAMKLANGHITAYEGVLGKFIFVASDEMRLKVGITYILS